MAELSDRRVTRWYKQQRGVRFKTKFANPIISFDSVSNKSTSIDATPLVEQKYLRNNSGTECLKQPRVVREKYLRRNPKRDNSCQDQIKNTTSTFCKEQFTHVSNHICRKRTRTVACSSRSKYNSCRQVETNKLISPVKRVLRIRQTQKQKTVLNITQLGEKKLKDVTKTIKDKQFKDSKTTKQSTCSLKPDLTCAKFGEFNDSMNKNGRYAKSTEQKQPTLLEKKGNCVCQYCKKTFSSHGNCMRHVRLHTNDRPYRCTMCAEAFTNSTYLKRHTKKMHTAGTVVSNQRQCKMPKFHGDAGFGKKVTETMPNVMNRIETMTNKSKTVTLSLRYNTDHMREHLGHVENKIGAQTVVRNIRKSDNIHETVKKRGNVKTNASAVNTLKKAHKTVKVSKVKCSSCHLCFSSQKYLNSHNTSVHGQDRICRFCKKSFSKVYNRVVHERLHTNEKPYRCTYCGEAYPNTNYLQRHVKKIHSHEIYVGWEKFNSKYDVNKIQGDVTTQQMQTEVVSKTLTQFGSRSLGTQYTNENNQVEHDTGKALHRKCIGAECQDRIKSKYSLKKNACETKTNGQIGIILDSKSIPDVHRITKPVKPKNQAPLQTQTNRQITACSKKCTNCHLAFTSQRKLNSHEVRVHERDLFVCHFCKKRLSTIFARVTHERLHTNEKPYECVVCDNIFPSNKYLKRHIMKYHKGDNGKMYTDKETVKHGVLKAADKQQKIINIVQQATKTKCSLKSAKQSTPLHYLSSELCVSKKRPAEQKVEKNNTTNKGVHMTENKQKSTSRIHHHSGVCSFCGKYFTRIQNCTAHEKYVHTGIKQNECLSGGGLFRYPYTLQHHKKKCGATEIASKIKQEKINMVLDSETVVKLHQNTNTNRRNHLNHLANATMNELSLCKPQLPSGSKTSHNHSGVCSYCGKYYTRLDNCMTHEKYVHLGLKQYKCLSCSEYFGYAHSLYQHRKKCHVTNMNTDNGMEKKSTEVLDAKGSSNFIIHHTNRTESTDKKEQVPHSPQINLSKVPQTHQGMCKFCGKYFTRKSNARIHERSVHLKLKPYKCFRCPVKFGWPDHLYKHVKQVHQGGAGFITCADSENAEGNKDGSVGRQTPKDKNNSTNPIPSTVKNASMDLSWTCDMCKVAFGCQKALLYHKRCHNGVRNAGIDEIKVPTKTLNYSEVHCTDKGLYKCDFCTAAFTQERQLKSHQFVHTRNKEHWYGCPQCGMKYRCHKNWMAHVMTHTKFEYLCKYCGMSFKVIKNWWTHECNHEKDCMLSNEQTER